MSDEVFDATVDWMAATISAGECAEVTFHGGEPLLAGKPWYRRNLPILQARFEGRLKLGIQSNLWLLDDEYCSLLKEYGVSIGTSLDGPEEINDAQRGRGYFAALHGGDSHSAPQRLEPGRDLHFHPRICIKLSGSVRVLCRAGIELQRA